MIVMIMTMMTDQVGGNVGNADSVDSNDGANLLLLKMHWFAIPCSKAKAEPWTHWSSPWLFSEWSGQWGH